jgi:hypothetical protein
VRPGSNGRQRLLPTMPPGFHLLLRQHPHPTCRINLSCPHPHPTAVGAPPSYKIASKPYSRRTPRAPSYRRTPWPLLSLSNPPPHRRLPPPSPPSSCLSSSVECRPAEAGGLGSPVNSPAPTFPTHHRPPPSHLSSPSGTDPSAKASSGGRGTGCGPTGASSRGCFRRLRAEEEMVAGVAWIRASSLNSLVLSARAGSSDGGDLGRGCFQWLRAKEEMVLSLSL